MSPIKKYGKGEVLPEPGDDAKLASSRFTDEDRDELAQENADADKDDNEG